MPNRVVREGILDSDRVNKLSWEAEVFYRRLMSIVDDFGRFDGRIAFIRSKLFPLRLDKVSEKDVAVWLKECETIGLVKQYQVEKKPYLELLDFNQSVRIKRSKYPQNPESTCKQVQADVLETNPNQNESEKKQETEIPHQIFTPRASKAEQFYEEFGNSPDLELVCMQGGIDKAEALKRLPEFKPLMNLTYKNSIDFATHFKNWMLKKGYTKGVSKSNTDIVGTFKRKHFRQ